MSALSGTQYGNGAGLQLQIGRFYDSTLPQLEKKIALDVVKKVSLKMIITCAYLHSRTGEPFSDRSQVLYEGTMQFSANQPIGPVSGMAQARALKPLLLEKVNQLWTNDVASKVAALPRVMAIGNLHLNLYAAIVDAELIFEKEEEPSQISFLTSKPAGPQIPDSYNCLVVPI